MSYRKIEPRMWDDERFASLSTIAKLTWVCLLTGPHTTGLPGLSSCGIATLSESMREGIDTVSKAVEELSSKGMVRFNRATRVMQIPNAPKYNPCPNEKVLKGWFALWGNISDCYEKFSHIQRLRDALDPHSSWSEDAWSKTFGRVSVPDRYGIDTVPISTATTTAAATTTELSLAPPSASPPTVLTTVATPPAPSLDLVAPTPKPVKPKRTPKPPADPPPFSMADAFDALASTSSGRFAAGVEGDWTRGVCIAIRKTIRRYPDLDAWRLVGAWLAAGGDAYRHTVGPSWAASAALPDAMARAREWDERGRGAINARHLAVVEPPVADAWTTAAARAGVRL